ncbi:hypothetical protein CLOSYM_00966 [[Clostridium] symbiosum ATCC 14940]|uniref:Uncharacterized protein n=1 Tax=[Clostridium] symbiosum ATCC 14940 TaxID=411472 RepID=A0ABC9U1L1_CLOSY|nr:hypothetical protein CLOSYM_00966 [[Clostridium] symbiosum ATCC 14940]
MLFFDDGNLCAERTDYRYFNRKNFLLNKNRSAGEHAGGILSEAWRQMKFPIILQLFT